MEKWCMLLMATLCVCLSPSSAAEEEYCFADTMAACSEREYEYKTYELENCNANFSGFSHRVRQIHEFANLHFRKSYDYMLLAANFGTHAKNRPGFQKLFRQLSDTAWENLIELIKYITKRGGTHDFSNLRNREHEVPLRVKEVNEIIGLSYALDVEKYLVQQADTLHKNYSHPNHKSYDAEVSYYLEKKFLPYQTTRLRHIAGYINDFKKLSSARAYDSISLSTYLFDEYLQKELNSNHFTSFLKHSSTK